MKTITKRNGEVVPFLPGKIEIAIKKAFEATGSQGFPEAIAESVISHIDFSQKVFVEDIQDLVEKELVSQNNYKVAKAYITYRYKRTEARLQKESLMQTYNDIVYSDAKDSDSKRENANVDTNTPMGTMLKIGSESAKIFAAEKMLSKQFVDAHKAGEIHIHDMDFLPTGTTTCCQIDLTKLFESGFSTGHGHLREPKDIMTYGALAAIAIQSNQNDQHGGQSIPSFDRDMAIGVQKTYTRELKKAIKRAVIYSTRIELTDKTLNMATENQSLGKTTDDLLEFLDITKKASKMLTQRIIGDAESETIRRIYQAMEAFLHNLNTMHSRAGAQVPFSSINYGTDTSPEGRLVIEQLLLATEAGLGNGETAIFPIQVFKVKEGVNFNPEDPNYDLYKLAQRVSAKRLFPNFVFIDAPFNKQYYVEGRPETEAVTMGCRTRVIGSVFPESDGNVYGRGNASFTSINLPRIAFEAAERWQGGEISKGQLIETFEVILNERLNLVLDQLIERFEYQCRKTSHNFQFLIGQDVAFGSDNLPKGAPIREVIKHFTLTIGFIGLAEALMLLLGEHHGETDFAQEVGLDIIGQMRDFCDRKAEELQLNISLIATPAEGLAGRFTRIDTKKYGVVTDVTDKEFYTNSFHVPVWHEISVYDKLRIEAPYHALCNAGHISYVEMDGSAVKNLEAFEVILRNMKELGIGYGSINHPVDRDMECGYTGLIEDECPRCARDTKSGEGVERIRRITGYLVGTKDKWNNAKQAEEARRVKHGRRD